VLAAALLVAVVAATAAHWLRYPRQARGHASDPRLVHFYGAPPMAIMVIGESAVTLRSARGGLPFSLAWWSFTFPLGTCVTGATQLALATGAIAFRVVAAAGFAGLVVAWLAAAAGTVAGLPQGRVFRPAAQ